MAQASIIPSFFLFGEAPKAVGDRFLHLETLEERTRPNAWNIRPHAHANLSHIMHIASGSGRMTAEGAVIAFRAPCALLAPAGVVHGFAYEPETSGSVLTLSDAYLNELVRRDPELGAVFAQACGVALEGPSLNERLEVLTRELAWAAPGHAAAVEGQLLGLLVDLLRQMRLQDGGARAQLGPQAQLVAQFREAIERGYRSGAGIEAYAADLGVTAARLRDACLKVAGISPMRLVHDRLLLEARRGLLYSNMTVAEVAFHLGFGDPAYFSRFFSKGLGVSPRIFRETRAGLGDEPALQ